MNIMILKKIKYAKQEHYDSEKNKKCKIKSNIMILKKIKCAKQEHFNPEKKYIQNRNIFIPKKKMQNKNGLILKKNKYAKQKHFDPEKKICKIGAL